MADESGYVIWVLHRMLPLLGEAYLRAGDLAGGVRVGERLRREGGAIEHRLGLALANACDAVVAWHSGDMEGGAVLLREAAECLEAIPFVFEAARVRRQLAGRLADLGDREGALAQLRELHDVFGRLGAAPELEKARGQFRELGARTPQTSHGRARDGALLTPREMEVALALADRRTNKGIASHLGIAPRTVTTHLSNIYKKLGIGSRGELIDRVREGGLLS
ncbi:MAG: LuxR C-terminal-related transcriptional regulator [Gemmatimonadetes bacterium]|nr:LuxR C-terminal-related transcriptional regulator [Gemmatimonadota bacterium]